ncbi:MAG: DUF1634 domain-containing protein [Acidimicrobiales bacterium]|jgi:uncharacterized membrane protein
MASETLAYGALMPPSPRGVRAAVGKVLRLGVLASAALLVAGYLVGLISDPGAFTSHALEQAHLRARASFPHSFRAVFDGICHGSGEAIIAAGVLLLIMTPVAGLLTAAIAFARRRDRLFGVIAASVLAIILGSFVLGSLTS